jgi:enoyl-CoA hydratase/carnithine racemase
MTDVHATATDVQLVVADGVATVTLARARTRNAIDTPFSREICARV